MHDLLPLFPLPNIVLFPNVFLPLHVFERRYREMVADALASDRLIGMVLLRRGWGRDDERRPPVYPIGCTGVITHVERLLDGRYNIVLRGLQRFRIVEEDASRPYRRAVAEWIEEPEIAGDDRSIIRHQRSRLEALLAPAIEHARAGFHAAEPNVPVTMGDEDLVNTLAQYLDLDPIEKQALLERHGLRARAESLVELLEMRAMASWAPWALNLTH
jgi:hypothetical protein